MTLVNFTVNDRVAYLEINRPEKKNAINPALIMDLKYCLQEAAQHEDVRVIVLAARGDCFSAGADLEYLQSLQSNTDEENLQDSDNLKDLFWQLYQMPKLTIAQVNGNALAGGCGLVSACDLAFAVKEANFGYTEVRIGFVPAIVMPLLIKKVGESKARELLLTGRIFTADEAKEIGLINWVADDAAALEKKVADVAAQICTGTSSNSIKMIKEMLTNIAAMPLAQAMQYGAEVNARARQSADCKKGIAAFLNKEKVGW